MSLAVAAEETSANIRHAAMITFCIILKPLVELQIGMLEKLETGVQTQEIINFSRSAGKLIQHTIRHNQCKYATFFF